MIGFRLLQAGITAGILALAAPAAWAADDTVELPCVAAASSNTFMTPCSEVAGTLNKQLKDFMVGRVGALYKGVVPDGSNKTTPDGRPPGQQTSVPVCTLIPGVLVRALKNPPYADAEEDTVNNQNESCGKFAVMNVDVSVGLSTTMQFRPDLSGDKGQWEASHLRGMWVTAMTWAYEQITGEIAASSSFKVSPDNKAFSEDTKAIVKKWHDVSQGDLGAEAETLRKCNLTDVSDDTGATRQRAQQACAVWVNIQGAMFQLARAELFVRADKSYRAAFSDTDTLKDEIMKAAEPCKDNANDCSPGCAAFTFSPSADCSDCATKAVNNCYPAKMKEYFRNKIKATWPLKSTSNEMPVPLFAFMGWLLPWRRKSAARKVASPGGGKKLAVLTAAALLVALGVALSVGSGCSSCCGCGCDGGCDKGSCPISASASKKACADALTQTFSGVKDDKGNGTPAPSADACCKQTIQGSNCVMYEASTAPNCVAPIAPTQPPAAGNEIRDAGDKGLDGLRNAGDGIKSMTALDGSSGSTADNKEGGPDVAGPVKDAATAGAGLAQLRPKDAGPAAGGGAGPRAEKKSGSAATAANNGSAGNLALGGSTAAATDGDGSSPNSKVATEDGGGMMKGGAGGGAAGGGAGDPYGGRGAGGGLTADGANSDFGSKTEDVKASGSEDPEDYFTRINPDENIFKRVEKRYRAKDGEWVKADLDKPALPAKK